MRGRTDDHVFTGAFKDRSVRILLVDPPLGEARYQIELDSPIGLLPMERTVISDVETVERLAEQAREREDEHPRLASLADTLLMGESDWRALFRVFGVDSVVFAGGLVYASAKFGDGFSVPDEAVRLERLLERLAAVSTLLGSILAVSERADSEARCPYCHDGLAEESAMADCPRCGARHHADCYTDYGRCAVFGCAAPEDKAVVRA
ncbi:hypothetical protein HY251_04145 [bacterium]|nr:hypothetical protein [bacterium]